MKKEKGFTLLEIVVVIAVLGILAGIVLPRLLNSTAGARGAKVVADLRTLDGCINHFVLRTGAPPTSIAALVPNYLAEEPEAPSSEFTVAQVSGGEKEFKAKNPVYMILDGRAVLDGFNVNYYLGELTIVKTQEALINNFLANYSGALQYKTIQNAWLAANNGSAYKLTDADIHEIFGDLVPYVYTNDANAGLYLKPMGVVINGEVQNVLFVSRWPANYANSQEDMRTYAIIVNGTTYITSRRTGALVQPTNDVGGQYLSQLTNTTNANFASIDDFVGAITDPSKKYYFEAQ